jgi:4'-phosphopantetheinyl transferase
MTADTRDTWAAGPLRPQLVDGAVHVWRADLTTVADGLAELLCSDERARAERFVNERDGELWGRSRGLLRALLGRYLLQEPASLRFLVGEHGKPALVEDPDGSPAAAPRSSTETSRAPRLSFNMSHSGRLALYAFSYAGAVGVDVEVARRPIDEVAIALRTLGAAEAQRLQALDPPARRREFLGAWARHEAELKCLGVGIGGGAADAERGLWVVELEIGPDVAAAVAAERPALELRCWEWQP